MTSDPDRQRADSTPGVATPSPTTTSGVPGGVRRRDWIVVAAVLAVVLGLGTYLLVRPTDRPMTADGSPPAQVPAASTAGVSTSASASTTSASTAPSSAAPSSTSAAPTPAASIPAAANPGGAATPPTSADPTSPPAESDVDTGPQKATKIGPLGDLARRQAGDPMAQGDVDAPVVMVMFVDYRCPFCAQFSRTTEHQLIDKYVTSGVLRIEWRDMPIFGGQSTAAAIAGRAAAAQGKFFEFTQAVYADAPQNGHADLTSQALIDYAKKAGVPDLDAFAAAMDDPAAAKAVAADLDESSMIGVPSVPAFVINGYPLLGAQPLTEFTTLIDTVQTLR